MLTSLVTAVWKLDEFLKVELFSLQGHTVTVGTVSALLLVLLATALLSSWLKRGLDRAARRRGTADEVAIAHAKRLSTYAVWIVGAWVGLEAVGIRLDALLAAGAVFAVGLGIALQPDAESVLAGIILLVERTVRPGDTLLFDGEPVQVLHMRIRSSIVRNLDGQDIVLPNRELVQRPIVHLTFDSPRHRLRVRVRMPLREDVEVVQAALLSAAASLTWRDSNCQPEVRLVGLEPSGVNWELQVWSDEPLLHEERRSSLIKAVVLAFQAAGLDLAPDRVGMMPAPPPAA
jgi:potassium-dependent mechanosensitive channel